jgi:uncharacterized protein (DUF488 family)
VTVFTIGHSTRTIDEFVDLLRAADVRQLADIRTVPKSRRCPQFNSDALARSLAEMNPARAGFHIAYRHIPALGGLRHPRRDSINTGWHNDSFRGYADYMANDRFREGMEELAAWAAVAPTAIMCAEAVWWRCHRRLVADALTVRGIEVRHIVGSGVPLVHEVTAFARVEGTTLSYPGESR